MSEIRSLCFIIRWAVDRSDHIRRIIVIKSMKEDINNNTTPDKASTIGAGEISPDEKRKKVGNYVILKTIGEGSFAKVRLGVHLVTEMKVSTNSDIFLSIKSLS